MTEKREPLTSQRLRERFINQFDLVNYAIRVAENMVKTGREPKVNTASQSPACKVLEEIARGCEVIVEPQKDDGEHVDDATIALTREALVKATMDRGQALQAD